MTSLLVRAAVVLVLLAGSVPPGGGALADPTPAAGADHAVALAGGHLSRLVTASGRVIGGEGLAGQARVLIGLAQAGVGDQAAQRIVDGLLLRVQQPDELTTTELSLVTLALDTAGVDVRRAGAAQVDLVAAISGRQRTGDLDAGMYGPVDPATAVPAHSLAVLALAAAGEAPSAAAHRWLDGQRCPASAGWPTYRDPASRSTGTCEVTPPDMTSTSLALQAQRTGPEGPTADAERFLRDSATRSGAFAPAPGLDPTTRATAEGVIAVIALTGDVPDGSWAGEVGGPLDLIRQEVLGCGWHGADRGAVPPQMRDTEGLPMPPAPVPPGAAAEPSTTATALSALAALTTDGPAAASSIAGDPFADCPITLGRIAGDSRLSTAVALSQATVQASSTVVVASAAGYADALAGSALAGSRGAPLLLSDPAGTSTELRAEVRRLGAAEVILLGGEAALSPTVAEEVAAIDGVTEVRRIAGAGRAETAALIAAEVGGPRAFLVRGFGPDDAAPWADALAAGAWSATLGIPVLLTDTDVLPPATAEALEGRERATVLGGTAAVSAAVQEEVAGYVGQVDRIAGASRYDTSRSIHRQAHAEGVDARQTWLATGASFPDALAAGPAIAAAGGSLLLVQPDHPHGGGPAVDAVQQLDHLIDALPVIGGRAAVPDGIAASLATTARAESAG